MRRRTALEQYQRLECAGLLREAPEAQRREVVVSLGEASLVMTDKAGRPVAHWSLPALIRRNPDEMPALYRPGPDAAEELELDDELMVEAVEQVRTTIERRRARPGRLRTGLVTAVLAGVLGLATLWLPEAIVHYTASVVPPAKRAEIGAVVLEHIHRVTGGECRGTGPGAALRKLAARLKLPAGGRIAVLAGGGRVTAHLPGGLILVNRTLVEDFETPDVLAGYVLAEEIRRARADPMLDLLREVGLMATVRLLTTGDLPAERLEDYGEHLLTTEPEPVSTAEALSAFTAVQVPVAPYAYALDPTGEATLPLIEADPFTAGGVAPLMSDADWVSLQGICGA